MKPPILAELYLKEVRDASKLAVSGYDYSLSMNRGAGEY